MSPTQFGELNSSTAPLHAKSSRSKRGVDALLNVTIVALVVLYLLSYKFPIFSPQLYAPDANYNFGTVRAGVPVKHTFTVRNLHPWSVRVTGVSSDCGCTRTFLRHTIPFTLSPFQTAEVATAMDTHLKKGNISQRILVGTGHSSTYTTLVVTGLVQ